MKYPSKDELQRLRKQYPAGTRLELIHMEKDPKPVPEKSRGTVTDIDSYGTIHMQWDNGRTLGLIPNVDTFVKI